MKLKKWRTVTHEELGITVDLGRLNYLQLPRLSVMMANVVAPLAPFQKGLSDEPEKSESPAVLAEKTAALKESAAGLDGELIEDVFQHKVRRVQGLETEDGPINTGKELLEVADQVILMWVLTELVSGSQMSAEEGKASGSPSTSASEAPPVSVSPVVSTVPAAGVPPSTVTPTRPGDGSSIPGV